MSEVCRVTIRTWQRMDEKWSGEARLRGPGKRSTKIVRTGLDNEDAVYAVLNGDVNELANTMGWERRDEG